jgi:hypothetical protein
MVLRNILGLKREELPGDWKRLHEEKLCDTSSPNINQVIKSRRLKCADV